MFGIRKREPSNYKCCVQSDAREPALIRTVASAFHLEYMMLVLMVRVFLVVSLKYSLFGCLFESRYLFSLLTKNRIPYELR